MLVERAVRANLWIERHRTFVAYATWTCFALVCADYARFIDLPEIVSVPAAVTGVLSGMRYAIWDGWLKKRLDARTQEAVGASGPQDAPEAAAPALPEESGAAS